MPEPSTVAQGLVFTAMHRCRPHGRSNHCSGLTTSLRFHVTMAHVIQALGGRPSVELLLGLWLVRALL